ncbi:MAG: hypothetical protein IT371_09725 [Deltaproteobacteria bacterium]|nr:hypothetical protein [Deltaproteobacteria bacterium]
MNSSTTHATGRLQALAALVATCVLCGASSASALEGSRAVGKIGPRTPVKTYSRDGRASLNDLYAAYDRLAQEHGWIREVVYVARTTVDGKRVRLPVVAYRTPQQGKAIWIVSGVHGEEPAGPNALAQKKNVDRLAKIAKERGIPMVVMPLLNPAGYRKNWRYQNIRRNWRKGKSVSDVDHLVLGLAEAGQDPTKTIRAKAISPLSRDVTTWIAKMSTAYQPVLWLDSHEDERNKGTYSYVYSQTATGAKDPVAQALRKILGRAGFPSQRSGKTRFGETIVNGVVSNLGDRSLEDLAARDRVVLDGKVVPKPAARSVIVPETPVRHALPARVAVHGKIFRSVEKFWDLLMAGE